jgi:hypothetical protein
MVQCNKQNEKTERKGETAACKSLQQFLK